MTRRTRGRDESGNAALELVLLTPVLFAVLGFVVFVGRLSSVQADVHAAAADAARAASLQRTPDAGAAAARTTAQDTLADRGVSCPAPNVDPDVRELGDGVLGGLVSVTITCELAFSDLAVPGLPGQRTVAATATSVIDVYRSG